LTGRSVLLAGLFSAKVDDPEGEMALRAAQVVAQGGVVVGQVVQRRGVSRSPRPGGSHSMNRPMAPATYLGKGKVEELAALRRATGAGLVVVCNDLSPTQIRNLERIVGCPVLDAAVLSARRG
jgi:hypothetical protein